VIAADQINAAYERVENSVRYRFVIDVSAIDVV
jgi:D-arabinose 1-dehydrogenase-like Zn-dependent alcohol dehydrogenase